MPRLSQRARVLHSYVRSSRLVVLATALELHGVIHRNDVTLGGIPVSANVLFLSVNMIAIDLQNEQRYLPGTRSGYVPKSDRWMRAVLPLYDAVRRAMFLRVSDRVFQRLVALFRYKARHIFKRKKGPSQHNIRLEVAIGLTRIGAYGNAASTGRIAALFGRSEGMVSKATSRTVLALCKIAPLLIRWPEAEKRSRLSEYADNKFGFKGAIGSTDGTTITLFKAPAITPWVFFDRKSRYSLHALVTVDHFYRVIDIVVNYLGTAPDSIVQRDALWQRFPEVFFLMGNIY